ESSDRWPDNRYRFKYYKNKDFAKVGDRLIGTDSALCLISATSKWVRNTPSTALVNTTAPTLVSLRKAFSTLMNSCIMPVVRKLCGGLLSQTVRTRPVCCVVINWYSMLLSPYMIR